MGADAGAEINKWLAGRCSRSPVVVEHLGFGVCPLALVRDTALHISGIHRNFNFQDIHTILRLREFLDNSGNNLWFSLCEFEAFLVAARFIVTHRLQEERDLVRLTFGAYAFYKRLLNLVDLAAFK